MGRPHRSPAVPVCRRRTVLRAIAGGVAGALALEVPFGLPPGGFLEGALGAESLAPLNGFPRMLQEDLVRRVRAAERRAEARRAAVTTREEAQAWLEDVRRRIATVFGPWPERSPLNPRVTAKVVRDGYRIENLIFESRPGLLVTANLYVPEGRTLPLPAVVGTCGHSTNGKAEAAYQSFAQGLARQGWVVLLYDPVGQGERLQYPDGRGGSRVGVGVREHLLAGNQQLLVGESLGAWRAWDGIRALDYLLSREEVDPTRVGVTGNSGGGTMTTWLAGVERRWAYAAPSCFVTTFRRNAENELPADTEQCPPRALELGLDHSDFLAAMAPKPVIILAKERDYFDVRGAEEAFERLRRIWALLDAEGDVGLFVGPSGHGYSQENREAMYRWFHRAAGVDGDGKEPAISIEPDAVLRCSPSGQVADLGSRSVPELTRERARELAASRPATIEPDELRRRVRRSLALDALGEPELRARVADYRVLRHRGARGYPRRHATRYALETEPGVHALVYRLADEPWYSRPPRTTKPATLWIADLSSDAELRDEPLLRELAGQDESTLYTCDVRGIGESMPDTCDRDSFLSPYGSEYFYAIHALMLGTPLLGMKTLDVLRTLDWLVACGHSSVHLVGRGRGALPATFAALLHERVDRVTLARALTSYQDVAEAEIPTWPLATLLPDVLRSFDLPDCYRALEAKRLRQIEPRRGNA